MKHILSIITLISGLQLMATSTEDIVQHYRNEALRHKKRARSVTAIDGNHQAAALAYQSAGKAYDAIVNLLKQQLNHSDAIQNALLAIQAYQDALVEIKFINSNELINVVSSSIISTYNNIIDSYQSIIANNITNAQFLQASTNYLNIANTYELQSALFDNVANTTAKMSALTASIKNRILASDILGNIQTAQATLSQASLLKNAADKNISLLNNQLDATKLYNQAGKLFQNAASMLTDAQEVAGAYQSAVDTLGLSAQGYSTLANVASTASDRVNQASYLLSAASAYQASIVILKNFLQKTDQANALTKIAATTYQNAAATLKLLPSSADTISQVAQTYYKAGTLFQSVQDYTNAASSLQSSDDAYSSLVTLYNTAKDSVNATAASIAQAQTKNMLADVFNAQAIAFAALNNITSAITSYTSAATAYLAAAALYNIGQKSVASEQSIASAAKVYEQEALIAEQVNDSVEAAKQYVQSASNIQ